MYKKSDIGVYYNSHNVRILFRDYIYGNKRFEKAIQCVVESVPDTAKQILDIGCGIGHSSWLFKEAFPDAKIIGVDISDISIEFARKLFNHPRISFKTADISAHPAEKPFDLVVMIDVYEHIPQQERTSLHLTLKSLIKENGWLVVTTPTIEHQAFLRKNHSDNLQIIDEDVTFDDLFKLAKDIGLTVVCLEKVAVWNSYDYQHFVGRMLKGFKGVPPAPFAGFKRRAINKLKKFIRMESVSRRHRRVKNVLGFDPLAQEQNGKRNE